jgi:hypothetical protein
MELMQKYVKEDGAISVDNLNRWHSNSDTLGLLSAMTSAASTASYSRYIISHTTSTSILIIVASNPEPSIVEGVTDRHNIFGAGLYT